MALLLHQAFLYRSEPMTFVHQTSTAVALIALSLWLQCGGIAALIGWARISLGPDTHKLGPLRSAVLMSPDVADLRSGGKCRWRLDVRAVR